MKTEHARIAEAVVADLFTSAIDGSKADRLVLSQNYWPDRNLGGLGKQAVRNAVLRALREHDKAQQ